MELNKIKLCSTCKNRAFNPECGVVCSFTNKKPTFEDKCESYDADAAMVSREAAQSVSVEKEKNISGWLAFFLWFGVGWGAFTSVIMGLAQTIGLGFGWFYLSAYSIIIASLLVTAILTITAFYGGKSNAVSLATTYIAMIVLDGVSSLIIAIICDDSSYIPFVVRQFCWGAVWLIYLRSSSKVELIVPVLTRTWNKLEKFILALYILMLSILTLSVVYIYKSENPQNILFTDNAYLDNAIIEVSKELPMSIADGIVLQRVVKEHEYDAIEFIYQLSDVYLSDSDSDYWADNALVRRHEALYELYEDPTDAFFATCFRAGYDVVYQYNDAASKTLMAITITPDDYKKALGEDPYKCPLSDLTDLVYKYNLQLPSDYMGDASLLRVYLANNDSELVYVVRLPQMSPDDLSLVTSSYLKEYVFSNWSALSDFPIRLAVVNQMDICFEFDTYSGIEHAKVCMTPEVYNAFE